MNDPQFEHDCDTCVFLGHYESRDWRRPVDLYVCPGQPGGATIIARYGDEGPEYGSGLAFCVSSDHYAEACKRAINGGHLDETLTSGNAEHGEKTLAELMDCYFGPGWRCA